MRFPVSIALFSAAFAVTDAAPYRASRTSPKVDATAVAILTRSDSIMRSLRSMTFTHTVVRRDASQNVPQPRTEIPPEVSKVRLKRPNMYVIERTGGHGPGATVSNGRVLYNFAGNWCSTRPVPQELWRMSTGDHPYSNTTHWSFFNLIDRVYGTPAFGYWAPARMKEQGLRSLRHLGRETWEGAPYDVVEWVYTIGYQLPEDVDVYTSKLYVGADNIVRRIVTTTKQQYVEEKISDVLLNPDLPDAQFATSRANASCMSNLAPDTGRYGGLPLGTLAPDFDLPATNGTTASLSKLLKENRAVLVYVWGYG